MKGSGTQDTHHGIVLNRSTPTGIVIRANIKNPYPQTSGGARSEVDAGLIWGDLMLTGKYNRIPGYALNVDHSNLVLRVVYSDGNEKFLSVKKITLESDKYYTYELQIGKDGSLVGKVLDGNTEIATISGYDTTYIEDRKYPGLFADFDGGSGYWDDFCVYPLVKL
jgi:hypothetical protein